MKKNIRKLIQVMIFAAAGVMVSTIPTPLDKMSITTPAPPKDLNSTKHEVVKTWPKIFYLSMDPNDPIVCYSGIKFNFTENENNTSQDGKSKQKIFSLSNDPLYPVTCRRGVVPASTDSFTVLEDNAGNTTNVTCIRRDYEKNVSAIFIHQTGPLDTAWNIFNNTIPYGIMTAKDVNNINEKNILKEYVVDCAEYGIDTGDKGICTWAAASLCG